VIGRGWGLPRRLGGLGERHLRLCVNLLDVNKAIIPETYPHPTMDELTERITGSAVFSKVDLLWGYLQLELVEDRRYLTSFVTDEGVYRFRSLPFGLVSGQSAFHKVVHKILDGLESCVSILDVGSWHPSSDFER